MKTLKHFVLLGILLLFVSSLWAAQVQIKVLKPRQDGGANVTGYIIEIRDEDNGSNAWVGCEVPFTDIYVYVINNLEAGHRYSFRVKTINKAGLSGGGKEYRLEQPLLEEIVPYIILQAPDGVHTKK